MPLVYQGWTLYARVVKLEKGPTVTIYFFAKRKPKTGDPVDLPPGLKVAVNKRTGLPFLRRESPSDVSADTRSTFLAGEGQVKRDLDEEE